MMDKHLVKSTSISFSLMILILTTFSPNVRAGSELMIEGNVLGYDLYTIKSTANPGLMYPALVEVTKILKGNEKSQYILLLFGTGDRSFTADNFGRNKTSTFKLDRRPFCDKKINSLLYPGLTLDDGKIVETSQTFTFVPGVDKASLPMEKKVPCYFVSREITKAF